MIIGFCKTIKCEVLNKHNFKERGINRTSTVVRYQYPRGVGVGLAQVGLEQTPILVADP